MKIRLVYYGEKQQQLEEKIDKIEERNKGIDDKLTTMNENIVTILERTSHIDTDNDLKNQIIEKEVDRNKGRIEKLEDNQKWLRRSLIGAIVAGVVALVFK